MAGVVHRTAALASAHPPETTTAPIRSTALTAAALATLALGLAFLMLPGPHLAPEIPPALFAAALGMMIATLLLARTEASVTSVDSHPSADDPSQAGSAVTSPAPTPSLSPPGNARPAVSGRGSAWRILSSPSSPGDETWLSWLPRERRRLGPEASVAVGVVTSPGRAGNLVAFPVRDYFGGALPPAVRGAPSPLPPKAKDLGLVGDEHLPALSSRQASPFSEEELDRMFPPEDRHDSVFLAEAPDRIGGRSAWANSAGFAHHAVGVSETPKAPPGHASGPGVAGDIALMVDESNDSSSPSSGEPSAPDTGAPPAPTPEGRAAVPREQLSHEAVNPVPPHLRASGTLVRYETQPPTRTGKRMSTSRSVCASCSKVVVDLRLSGPCPRCLRPLCNDCLREAFVTVGRGWCLDCASAAAVGS